MDPERRGWWLLCRVSTEIAPTSKGQYTQTKRSNDLVQCTTNLFNDHSQLTRKANGSLSRSESVSMFGGSRASESLFDVGSSTGDGGVNRSNVRYVGGVDRGCVLACSMGLQSRGGSV